jgi:hypothetical protein
MKEPVIWLITVDTLKAEDLIECKITLYTISTYFKTDFFWQNIIYSG